MSNLTTSCFILKTLIHFARNHPSFKMIGQSKISTFFGPKNNKRTADTGFDQNTPPKKSKTSDEQDNVTIKTLSPEQKQKMEANKLKAITKLNAQMSKDIEDTSSPEKQTKESTEPLSPEQKEKINENKLKALAKLNASNSSGIAVGIGVTWNTALQSEFTKPYFVELSKFVERERASGTVYPPPNQVFTWTHLSDIDQVKVVILGQDPYHGPGQAHGLCFSVQKGIKPPPSLQNMYKELASDIEGFKHPGHGTLNGWAEQGVLLLNACLTVRAHNANSHAGKGWEKFTDAVISWFNKHKNGIVFMLWGSYAQKKGACIDKKRNHILKAVHPSPLSAHRGFFGCKHFSQCNSLLKDQGKKPIDWTRLPPE